ncbi:hypothetical protein [Kutzneria sp. 744]|uniref:WD40/YVTN/BNR-like repeat-containing protein n=1 Tax=Kutzneria sp. (strain 744) TaxID=345341 RepID=UPI0003EED5BF|nr:hypothetical protein [Kutzneria sp. 744]EWM14496.1 LigA protein [Kutzneria sp. 744]
MRGKLTVVVLLALALAGCGRPAPAGPSDPALGFVRHDNAVSAPTADGGYARPGAGIRHLLTVDQCAVGVGVFENGYRDVGANWTGDTACTRFSLPVNKPATAGDRPPSQGGWDGSGLAAHGAVALNDGSVIGVDSSVQRLAPDGSVTTLADLHLPWHKPSDETGDSGRANSVVQSGDRLVIGGGQTVGGHSAALMWTSTDGGHTLAPVELPQAEGNYVGPMASSDNTIVASASAGGGRLTTWRSTDGGQSWQQHEIPSVPGTTSIAKVLRTEHGWLIVGSDENRPFLASSPDGVAWTKTDTAALGSGVVLDATGGKDEDIVLVGASGRCGVVWTTSTDGSWQRGDLGCDDAPQAVTTLADGRVIAVGVKDVWVRA